MRNAAFFILFVFLSLSVRAQELFPIAETASNVPKGALGVRVFDEGYNEDGLFRNLLGLKLLYGVTPKLSVYITSTFSNFHEKTLPFDFISHNHNGGQLVSGTNTPQEGIPYPYIFNSVDGYAKYRFITSDGEHTHFRMSAYGEVSYVAVPSHEAEPDLLIHTSGFGAGVIATYLVRHFAASITTGFIIPAKYTGDTYDKYGGVYPTTIHYGKSFDYDLSFGYLLFPQNYKSYTQSSWSVFCEFIGKTYGAAKVTEQDGPFTGALTYDLPITTPLLKASSYVDINPGVQCIIKSTYRIDLSVGFRFIDQSYNHLYPLYSVGVQRYLYFNKHSSHESGKL